MTVPADDSGAAPAAAGPPRARRRRLPAVPVTAVVTLAVLGLAQTAVLAVWAGRHDRGLRDVMIRWDAGWMTKIAEFGYFGFSVSDEPVEWQSVAFLPGYPVLVRIVSAPLSVFGLEDAIFIGAVTVSVLASVVFAWGVAQLAVDIWSRTATGAGLSPVASTRTQVAITIAVTVLAFGAPMGFLYWMPFTEGLFGALTAWMLVMVLRRRFLAAGVLTLLAGLTRITAVALVLTLVAVAVVELWHWSRRRTSFPGGAVAAPVVGSLGLAAYIAWADRQTAEIGGYFAAQERGWQSHVDFGVATFAWLREHMVVQDVDDANAVAYVLSSWVIIAVGLLCAASCWPLLRGWIPWQVWLVAIVIAGSVLGSDGIMHARPRLLMMAVVLLVLPFVLRGVQWAARDRRGRVRRSAVLAGAGALWCVLGFAIFGWMLVEFQYGI